ncbi:MAG: hypothetical protein GEU75_04245 [Dehalococcoidia bacterium]|nr:hypothetical protein [Dehalococcoidia bacterium]
MTFAGEKPDIHGLPEYKLAASTRELIEETVAGMTWTRDWEWLRVGILREAGRLTQTLEDGYTSDLMAEWILGIGSCRNAVVMSDYIFTFLKGQSMLEEAKADPILSSLKDLMAAIMALSQQLRQDLAARRSKTK